MTEVIVRADPQAVAREAVAQIVAAAERVWRTQDMVAIALAGGSTPREAYRLWARTTFDWSRLQLFFGDERGVPADDAASNYRMVREALLDAVPLPATQVHRIPGEAPDLNAAAWCYEQLLRRRLGDPPRLDVALLGLGSDAHTASLFPHHAAVHETNRLVLPTPAPAIAPRLTLTPVALNAAQVVVFLVTGAEKRNALRNVWHAAYDPDQFPAQAIMPHSGRLLWLVDHDSSLDVPLPALP